MTAFEFLERSLGVLLAFDDFDHACGLISPDVVPDDGINTGGFFAVQRISVRGWFNPNLTL